jgi:hypothetical protein
VTTPADSTEGGPPKGASTEEIEADIARTRERLGDTVDALSERLDVKAQAKKKAQQTTDRAKSKAQHIQDQAGPALPIGAAVAVVLVVALIIWRRQR